jgi:hypothetical protein
MSMKRVQPLLHIARVVDKKEFAKNGNNEIDINFTES